MVDNFTKCVLSVIAAALLSLALEQWTRPATAQSASCGMTIDQACWVRADQRTPMAVEVIGR
jgi:hypothetical protein